MSTIKRPELLEALCRLSFAGSGTGFLLYFVIALFYPHLEKYITDLTNISATEGLSTSYFLCFSLFFGISFIGVLKMWKLQKAGFFLYMAAQVAIVIYPLLQLGEEAFSSVSLIFSLLFVVLYSSQFLHKSPSTLGTRSQEE